MKTVGGDGEEEKEEGRERERNITGQVSGER